jgi:hypothetical protein
MIWRNERSLYKRKCDKCNKDIITIYPAKIPLNIYCRDCWWSDKWEVLKYGMEISFNKPFLHQLRDLIQKVPWTATMNSNCVDSDYCNWARNFKNCYLVYRGHDSENCLYSSGVAYDKDCLDIFVTKKSELCYETLDCVSCYKLFFGSNCENCTFSFFLDDCKNCSNCFACVGLRNKQYHIFNQPYSKENYFKELGNFDLSNFQNLVSLEVKFREFDFKFPKKFQTSLKTINSLGNYLVSTKDCQYCYDSTYVENGKFLFYVVDNAKDSYDSTFTGVNVELCYEMLSCIGTNNKFSIFIMDSHDILYSFNCHASSNLFGCVGLRNKQYCILNKQYSKEEYEELVPKIIKHMNDMPYVDKKGRIYKYGEFFPPELSPFAYNETIAQEYFPLTKEQAIEQGYSWKDPEPRHYTITMTYDQLPDHIKDVPDSITEEIIGCSHEEKCNEQCTQAFKIIPDELQFLRKMNLPLPRLCPNCRHYQRLKQRNPLKLWHRKCMCAGQKSEMRNEKLGTGYAYENTIAHFHGNEPCQNEFETSYAPERPEIVYCEQCYNAEVA